MLPILLEILDRLRYIPGLTFLDRVYRDVYFKKQSMELQARKLNSEKKRMQSNLQRVKEIPSVVKGSKKRT
jgi:hypothetical protein